MSDVNIHAFLTWMSCPVQLRPVEFGLTKSSAGVEEVDEWADREIKPLADRYKDESNPPHCRHTKREQESQSTLDSVLYKDGDQFVLDQGCLACGFDETAVVYEKDVDDKTRANRKWSFYYCHHIIWATRLCSKSRFVRENGLLLPTLFTANVEKYRLSRTITTPEANGIGAPRSRLTDP